MNRSPGKVFADLCARPWPAALALGVIVIAATAASGAAAQGMTVGAPTQASPWPATPGPTAAPGVFGAPPASQCDQFPKLRADTEQKATVIQAINKRHGDRKEMCAAVTKFTAAEGAMVKFLQDNMTWCGVPQQAVTNAKAAHEKTLKFRDIVCAEGPKPRVPTLSDAIGTPSLDTAKNTKTGIGTFDTLTGNPLAK